MVSGTTASKVLGSFCVAVFAAALLSQGFGVFPPPGGSGTGLPTGCTDAGGGAIQCSGGFAAGDGTSQSKLLLPELTTNGTSEWGIFGPGSLAADRLYVMPSADSNGGDCLSDSGTTTMTSEDTPRVATVLVWVACGGSGGGLSKVGMYMYDSATSKYYLGPNMIEATPPVVADWTAFGTGGTLTAVDSAMTFDIPPTTISQVTGITVAEPGATYTCTAGIMPGYSVQNYHTAGLFWTDGTQAATIGMTAVVGSNDGSGLQWGASKLTDYNHYTTSYTPTLTGLMTGYGMGSIIWMQLSKTASDRISRITFNNGYTWQVFHTVAKNDFLTTTRLGIYGDDQSVNNGFQITVVSWKCVTP